MAPRRQIKLGGFFHPTGNHIASWLHPDSQLDAGRNFNHYVDLAQTSERGKFDLIFLADSVASRAGNMEALKRWPQYMTFFEPTTLLSALAPMTKRIGLVSTATTSYNEPYNIARRFASLDMISNGRAGWNVVTSFNPAEAFNFNAEALIEHEERYDRALEFVSVCKGLWDSWEDDAFIRDRKSEIYFDPAKLHPLNHEGNHFKVRGPLNIERSPQGYPVLAQAGASPTGKDFASQIAEIIFTPLQTLAQAQAFYKEIKDRADTYGRRPDEIKIMPGLNAIVGRTDEEAEEKFQLLQSKIHPDVGRQLLSSALDNMDLSPYDVDGPLPYDIILPPKAGSPNQRVLDKAKAENWTIRQLYQWYGGARGQRTLKGSPQTIADDIEEWLCKEGVDGFLIQPGYLPGGLTDFVDMVVPELQHRGLFRKEYEGKTLRENLGLKRPPNRYAA
jgi:N-acetyl-S-(2-succino)cysteine monooxygenase